MSALPTTAFFRRFALPAHFASLASGDTGCHQSSSGPTRMAAGPRLVASWDIGPAGHPVCRWTVQYRVLPVPG